MQLPTIHNDLILGTWEHFLGNLFNITEWSYSLCVDSISLKIIESRMMCGSCLIGYMIEMKA